MDFVNFFLLGGYLNHKSVAIFIMMTGFVVFLMWGIWNGKNWIRLVWIVMSIMGISTALLNILTKQMIVGARIIYSIQFVLSLAILYYLTNKKTVSWFKGIKPAPFPRAGTNDQELTKERLKKKKEKLKFSNQEEYEKWKAGKLKTTTEWQQNEPGTKNDSRLVPGEMWKDPFLGMEFVFVNGGWFEMEDTSADRNRIEKPAYKVYLDGFWMGRFTVTQGQWEKLMHYNPSGYKKGNGYPVEHVSWDDVGEFIFRLNQKTAMSFRLPTEEEWEYAARSGGGKEKWAGTDNESELPEYAWYGINSLGGPQPVGEKRPNGLGLYDMSGNVWEWVQKDYEVVEGGKVIRGGSWSDPPTALRTSARACVASNDRVIFVGFRLVLPIK
jgi:formylglycine-generating enzyme required for sulfatase activity